MRSSKQKELDYKFNIIVGEYLKKARCRNNLTLDQVAMRVRTTRQNIYKYESGLSRLKVDMYISICYALQLEPGITYNEILEEAKKRGL